MSEEFQLGLTLMVVGVLIVLVILSLVVGLGNTIILYVNRFFPEGEKKIAPAAASSGQTNPKHMAVIAAAVAELTGGRGHVVKIEKES